MKDTAKKILRAALNPKTLILGVAAYNFIVIWIASSAPCMGYICPWYDPWRYANEPTRLLVAACLLRAGKDWSYSAAIALFGFLILEGAPGYADIYASGFMLESLSMTWGSNPFLSPHAQYLLAAVILMYATVCWGKDVHLRRSLLR